MSAAKKTLTSTINIWWNENDGHIHLSVVGNPGIISTITDKPNSKRAHPHLFRKLSKLLKQDGKPSPFDSAVV